MITEGGATESRKIEVDVGRVLIELSWRWRSLTTSETTWHKHHISRIESLSVVFLELLKLSKLYLYHIELLTQFRRNHVSLRSLHSNAVTMVHKVLFWSGFGTSTCMLSLIHRLTKEQALPYDYGSSALKCAPSSCARASGPTQYTRGWARASATGLRASKTTRCASWARRGTDCWRSVGGERRGKEV